MSQTSRPNDTPGDTPVRGRPRNSSAPRRRKDGWQAEKSATTRKAILEAAITCLIELGYANTTTALIANYAKVSRGAMMHHFPSRIQVLKALVDYLHDQRLKGIGEMMNNIDMPDENLSYERIKASVATAWKYVNLPSFVAFHELLFASRTDAELKQIIEPIERGFEKHFMRTVKSVFPHWEKMPDLQVLNDLVQYSLRGIALSHLTTRRKTRARDLVDLLADVLYDYYLKHQN